MPANSNFQLKLRKENMYILSFSAKKLPERLLFYRAHNMHEKDEYLSSEFYYPEYLETSDVDNETAQRGHGQFLYKQTEKRKRK